MNNTNDFNGILSSNDLNGILFCIITSVFVLALSYSVVKLTKIYFNRLDIKYDQMKRLKKHIIKYLMLTDCSKSTIKNISYDPHNGYIEESEKIYGTLFIHQSNKYLFVYNVRFMTSNKEIDNLYFTVINIKNENTVLYGKDSTKKNKHYIKNIKKFCNESKEKI